MTPTFTPSHGSPRPSTTRLPLRRTRPPHPIERDPHPSAMGGNKARKLEYLMRDAIEKGCDTVVAAGGAQSNFARMTAGATAHLGMKCGVCLFGDPGPPAAPATPARCLLGAELHFAGADDWDALWAEVRRIAADIGPNAYPCHRRRHARRFARLSRRRRRAAHPDGRASRLDRPATGSGGAQAGLLAGLRVRCASSASMSRAPTRPSP